MKTKRDKSLMMAIIFFSVAVVILGITYAYFVTNVLVKDSDIVVKSGKIDIYYDSGQDINGLLFNSLNRTSGLSTTVGIKKNVGSINVDAGIYLNIETLPLPLRSEYLIWEVYRNDEEIALSQGNFKDVMPGDTIQVVDRFSVSNDISNYHIYIWLDGNGSDNSMQNQSFSANVYASAYKITASDN